MTAVGADSDQRNRISENKNVSNSRNRSSLHDGSKATADVGTVGAKRWGGREGLHKLADFRNHVEGHPHRSFRALKRTPESLKGCPYGVDTGTKGNKGQIGARKEIV